MDIEYDVSTNANVVIWSDWQSCEHKIWKKITIEKSPSDNDQFAFQDLVSGKYLSRVEYDTPTGIEGNYDRITSLLSFPLDQPKTEY